MDMTITKEEAHKILTRTKKEQCYFMLEKLYLQIRSFAEQGQKCVRYNFPDQIDGIPVDDLTKTNATEVLQEEGFHVQTHYMGDENTPNGNIYIGWEF